MNRRNFTQFRHSLLLRYLVIIAFALMFLPIVLPATSVIYYSLGEKKETLAGTDIEKLWHEEASELSSVKKEVIPKRLEAFQRSHPRSSVFWIDEKGTLVFSSTERADLPIQWDSSYTIEFMKQSYDADPFTSVAFIGQEKEKGFIVFQIPREALDPPGIQLVNRYYYLFYASMLGLLLLFVFISWWFFYRIRKRLLHLERTMETEGNEGIPLKIETKKKDEIGQLEQSFNRMVQRLEDSHKQQLKEEALRRDLIANLSHDLRTPLTTLRGQLYALKKENLTEQGKESLTLMDHKITYLGQLIDNLLSYTLLTSGKYPYHPEKLDLMRTTRKIAAAWYPAFEKEGFEIDIDLPETIEWEMDPSWFERVLDNVFQNSIRHAKKGRYIGIKGRVTTNGFQLFIQDHGPGFAKKSENSGVGIGMIIVSLMLREMDLELNIDTGDRGTVISITGDRNR